MLHQCLKSPNTELLTLSVQRECLKNKFLLNLHFDNFKVCFSKSKMTPSCLFQAGERFHSNWLLCSYHYFLHAEFEICYNTFSFLTQEVIFFEWIVEHRWGLSHFLQNLIHLEHFLFCFCLFSYMRSCHVSIYVVIFTYSGQVLNLRLSILPVKARAVTSHWALVSS